jgi:hypothetical protein
MTDDFVLFPDAAGAGGIDADIALVTAFLAGELSPVQIMAVQDRLETDAAFRERAEPIIRAWTVPGARRPGVTRRARSRFLPIPAFARSATSLTSTRSRTMKRVAAIFAVGVLPMAAAAQFVAFAAAHPDAPGHGIARWIAAPFVNADAPPRPALPMPSDAPVARSLALVLPDSTVARESATEQPQQQTNPTRARVMELVRQHQQPVLQGDSSNYVVMVVDSAGSYVWSTRGTGSYSIEATGDPRGRGARVSYVTGASNVDGVRLIYRAGDTVRMTTDYYVSLTSAQRLRSRIDSALADSLVRRRPVAPRDSQGRIVLDSGRYIVNYARADSVTARLRSGYDSAFRRTAMARASAVVNRAPGLRTAGGGESGIEGLRSASVERADAHRFEAGQLAPKPLDVLVVRLAPGTTWRGR